MSAKCLKCEKHVLDCQCQLGFRDTLYRYKDYPTAKDHCAGCEHPEVIRMLIPKLEELEKKIAELEQIIDKSNLRKCRFYVDDEIDIKVF